MAPAVYFHHPHTYVLVKLHHLVGVTHKLVGKL